MTLAHPSPINRQKILRHPVAKDPQASSCKASVFNCKVLIEVIRDRQLRTIPERNNNISRIELYFPSVFFSSS